MHKEKLKIGDRELIFEVGKVANQSNASVWVRYGDTVVLTSCVSSKPKEQVDFLPLLVEYREQTYAAGKIPGGFFKREGKPRDREIIYGRAIDRAIRPLFPKNFYEDIQVVAFLLSYDMEQEGDLLGLLGASCALSISDIPFDGPFGAVRIGYKDRKFILNPVKEDLEKSDFSLLVAGKNKQVLMIEFQGREISEELLVSAVEFAFPTIDEICNMQHSLIDTFGKPKRENNGFENLQEIIDNVYQSKFNELREALFIEDKIMREKSVEKLKENYLRELLEKYPGKEIEIKIAMNEVERKIVREEVVNKGIRQDGRKDTDVRPISCEIGVLPRTHGSALFTRGQTQALVVTTLGTREDEQRLSELEGDERKRFMLHYNFPPFATGDIKPIRAPSRREIGHGNLAEKSLEFLIPSEEEFPYTIRIVSDILESNGSSSMASVCGASLSLMDAGVKIPTHVAGVSIGLMEVDEKYRILADIIGAEDYYGDMDFKVAGTMKGITAIQLDLKREGLPIHILESALKRAKEARNFIIDVMSKTISRPRESISRYAPKVTTFFIPKEKIGEVIGPSGKIIKGIIEKTGVSIDIDDTDSKVMIYGNDMESVEEAKRMVEEIVQEVEVGKIYKGKVIKIAPFGVFVEFLPKKYGLVHISELDRMRIKAVEEVVKIGDEIPVMVIEIDSQGRIRLSRKKALEKTLNKTKKLF